jgi:uncharacterized protein
VRVVLDVGVLAAAFTTRGLCADVLRAVLTAHTLLTAKTVLRGLRRMLLERAGVPVTTVDQIIPFLRQYAEPYLEDPALPDSGETVDITGLVRAATAAGADALVTNRRAVREIGRETPLAIVAPRDFWELLRRAAERR